MNVNNPITICFSDYTGSLDFFFRIAKSYSLRNYIIITPIFSSIIKSSRYENIKVIYINKLSKKYSGKIPTLNFSNCKESNLSLFSNREMKAYFLSLYSAAKNIIEHGGNNDIVIFNWNGESISGLVTRMIKNKYKNIKTLYFEISNLPGLTFMNEEGVNASSSLYKDPDQLLFYQDNKLDYSSWLHKFISDKLSGENPPKQVNLMKKKSVYLLIDLLFSCVSYRFFSVSSILNRLPRFKNFTKNKSNIKYDKVDYSKEYVFIPLQVSNDTQVLINSDIGNIDLILEVLSQYDLPLYIKPHPAESNVDYLFFWLDSLPDKVRSRVFIVNENTYKLINGSNFVCVINSTVGFESMLMGKDTKFFGRTIYTNFTFEHLEPYIFSYLLNVDFFSNKLLMKNDIIKIYLRCK